MSRRVEKPQSSWVRSVIKIDTSEWGRMAFRDRTGGEPFMRRTNAERAFLTTGDAENPGT
jgi:hypothetical protein